jgi:WD40 repeat protein
MPTACEGLGFSPDGTLLATVGDDASVRLWDPVTGSAVSVMGGHSGAVSGVAFSPGGTLLPTGSWDKTSRLRA